jgi:hypothetical protein
MPKPILKSGVRILRPAEYEQLREGAGKLEHQTRSDALLLTGLRYVEAQRLQTNPKWADGRFIHLPASAQRKVLRTQKERWVRLSSKGASLLPYFFKTKPLPTWKGLDPGHAKMGRKFPVGPYWTRTQDPAKKLGKLACRILSRTGPGCASLTRAPQMTALSHYLRLPFTQGDKGAMLEYVSGWT